jgi:hypothetical protein
MTRISLTMGMDQTASTAAIVPRPHGTAIVLSHTPDVEMAPNVNRIQIGENLVSRETGTVPISRG